MKKATIIIPVYNSEKYIERCMESIVSQIDEQYEVLLINDGSKDRSEDIINAYAKKYPDIVRAISKENEGTAKTRNLGIKEARGEFIFFIDNDDFVDRGYFKQFIDAIDEKSDIVVGGYRRVEDKKVKFQSSPKNSSWYKYTVVAPWAKIYKREFLLKNDIRFLDYGLGEDVYFNVVAYSKTKSVKVIDYVGYNWYFNTKSVSNTSQRGFNPDLNVVHVLHNIYQRIGNSQVLYSYFYVRYGVWYLLFSGRKASSDAFLKEYKKIFGWYDQNRIQKRFPLFGKETKGDSFFTKLTVNVFLMMDKLKLVNVFAKLYCSGK